MVITKKIWPEFFNDIVYRNKRFEIRKDDCNIQPGDALILAEWDPQTSEYMGRNITCIVKYVFRSNDHEQDFGLKPGYCVIGFAPVLVERS